MPNYNFTKKEAEVIAFVYKDCMTEPFSWVHIIKQNLNLDQKTIDGVLGSLTKKGVVQTSPNEYGPETDVSLYNNTVKNGEWWSFGENDETDEDRHIFFTEMYNQAQKVLAV